MDPRPIVDKDTGNLLPSRDTTGRVWPPASPEQKPSELRFPGEDGGKSLAEMARRDLTATLQLLAESAQYITGATGAAIALRDQDELVCRASAGSSAPEVGALLQVNSGLSGESVRTRQTLRCDDAFIDPRVNRESCAALGIRSVVVMPLIRGEEVIGVFELFSDKANIFETRDLVALERMGTMVHTALEHSTAALGLPPMLGEVIQPARAGEGAAALPAPQRDQPKAPGPEPMRSAPILAETSQPSDQFSSSPVSRAGIAFHGTTPTPTSSISAATARVPAGPVSVTAPSAKSLSTPPADEDDILEEAAPPPAKAEVQAGLARASFESLVARADQELILSDRGAGRSAAASGVTHASKPAQSSTAPGEDEADDLPVALTLPRTAVTNLKKCAACGFPVSEGRQLCLDCEKKKIQTGGSAVALPAPTPAVARFDAPAENAPPAVPNFMIGDDQASWLSNHKFTVVALVLAAVGIVAIVLLR
jgi:putative methionine-R-sulfoxide reductase with GAF domain